MPSEPSQHRIPYWFVTLRNHSLSGDCAYRPSSRASAIDIVPATAAAAMIRAEVLHRSNHSTSASRSNVGVHPINRNGRVLGVLLFMSQNTLSPAPDKKLNSSEVTLKSEPDRPTKVNRPRLM